MTFGLLALIALKLLNEKLLSCWTADGWEWRPSWSCDLHNLYKLCPPPLLRDALRDVLL